MRRLEVSAVGRTPVARGGGEWRATMAGACASLVGIGLARFAYTPLLPAIIGAHWFAASAAAYLGAANLAGYLAGALMVLAAPIVLPHIPQRRRGIASGVIFAGVGLGIAASGTLVPLLLRHGLAETWCGLGVLSLILTGAAWGGWPAGPPPQAALHDAPAPLHRRTLRLRAVYAEYGLNALGLVPHMLFLVDYVARGLGQGLDSGAQYWVVFGLGAIAGPVLSGHLADRTGFGPALRLAIFVQGVCVVLPALGTGTPGLIVSSVVMGAFTPGVVPLVLGRVHELLPHDAAGQKAAWSTATTVFALFQAAAAYGLTFIFTRSGGDYRLLFLIGAAAFVASLGIDLAVGVSAARRARNAPRGDRAA